MNRVDRRRGVCAPGSAAGALRGDREQPALRAVGAGWPTQKPLSCPPERYTRAPTWATWRPWNRRSQEPRWWCTWGAVPDPFGAVRGHRAQQCGRRITTRWRRAGARVCAASCTPAPVMTDWGYQFDEPYRAIREARFGRRARRLPPASRTTMRRARPSPTRRARCGARACAVPTPDGHGLSCLCLRIGGVNKADAPQGAAGAALWCSQRDGGSRPWPSWR